MNKPSLSTLAFVRSQGVRKALPAKTLNTFLFDTFNIHFIRKEKLYTKLKYSRCPQYDIVSGGFAALLAGFIGFLVGEKFGIELVDAGDFYNALMYAVFASFSIRPLIRIYSEDNSIYTPFSLKHLAAFVRDLILLGIMALKRGYFYYPTSPKFTKYNLKFAIQAIYRPISSIVKAPSSYLFSALALVKRLWISPK